MARKTHALLLFLIFQYEAHANEWDSRQESADTSNYEDLIEPEVHTTTSSQPNDLQRVDKPLGPSERHYTFHPEIGSWIEALVTCWKNGKELAVPRSPQEAEMLADLLLQNVHRINQLAEMKDAVHIGIRSKHPTSNVWVTIEGQKISQAGYNQWLDGGEGNCGALFSDGRFFQQSCKTQLPFICQTVKRNSFVDQNYTRIPGVGRIHLHTSPLPWVKARKKCEAEGAALLVPNSARVAGLVAGALLSRASPSQRSRGCFIGANDVVEEGKWVVASGLTLREYGYESWRPNQPSGNRSENCAVLMEDGLYADYPCLSPLPFCCEIPEYPAGTSETVFESGGYRLHVEELNWWEAVISCHKQNMTLAAPRKQSDGDNIQSLIRRVNSIKSIDLRVYIGIHNMNKMETWTSLEGNAIRYYDPYYESYNSYASSRDSNVFYEYRINSRDVRLDSSCGTMGNTYTYYSDCFVSRSYVCAPHK